MQDVQTEYELKDEATYDILQGIFIHLSPDLEYERADDEKDQNPGDGDEKSSVDVRLDNAPASGEDSSERLTGEGLWQNVADVSEILRHPLQGPDDARQQEVGVEAAESQLNGVLLVITEG